MFQSIYVLMCSNKTSNKVYYPQFTGVTKHKNSSNQTFGAKKLAKNLLLD